MCFRIPSRAEPRRMRKTLLVVCRILELFSIVIAVLFVEMLCCALLACQRRSGLPLMIDRVFIDSCDGGKDASMLSSVIPELRPILLYRATRLSQILSTTKGNASLERVDS